MIGVGRGLLVGLGVYIPRQWRLKVDRDGKEYEKSII